MAAPGNTADSSQQVSASVDVFITDELQRRGPRKADPLQQKQALQDLARQMSEHSADILPHLVDRAMTITRAAAAGISLYEEHPQPGVFRWHHLRGSLKAFDGATTPRHFSPCGVCLDRAEPTLTEHPERVYTWIADAGIVAPEVLLVPLYLGGPLPLGTLWVLAERVGHFDRGHARVLTELATFAGMAVNMLRTEERLQKSLARQELLAREMSHRVKNLFMLVNGMIHVSARSASSPKEMAQALTGRVRALAEAHALVHRELSEVESSHPVSDLAQLLNKILDPHENAGAPGPTRFRLDGPLVSLGERATNGVALVCHELATNAAKYGALTSDSGTVQIAWQLIDKGLLKLVWQERGGPIIAAPPIRSGFGTKLVHETISELGGTIAYDWQAEGLAIHIAVPATRLVAGGEGG